MAATRSGPIPNSTEVPTSAISTSGAGSEARATTSAAPPGVRPVT
ncbi:MAG TPA: hypothetical protein VHG93_07315 [Longimicrobium sp.]|nr:hypothetical protein [Longimicrobium sp.]